MTSRKCQYPALSLSIPLGCSPQLYTIEGIGLQSKRYNSNTKELIFRNLSLKFYSAGMMSRKPTGEKSHKYPYYYNIFPLSAAVFEIWEELIMGLIILKSPFNTCHFVKITCFRTTFLKTFHIQHW